jgi:ATP-dependent Clp protease ATP-binding subunit ClpA
MAGTLPDPARRLIERAADIAYNAGSSTVEPVHLLFAVAADGDNMVKHHGVTLKPERSGRPEGHGHTDAPVLSERAIAVIDAARQTAIRRGEIPLRVSHIALALMRSRDRWLHDTLQANGADAAGIIRELLRELGGFNIAAELFGNDYNVAVWSEEAQRIVRAAPYEAAVFAHDYIGSEHILLSLLRDAVNPAARFLEAFYNIPITIAGVPSAVKAVIGGGGLLMRHRIDFTPNANRAIADAQLAASRMGRSFVGSEHIIVAIIMNRDCAAARALAKRVNLDALAKDVAKTFGSGQ